MEAILPHCSSFFFFKNVLTIFTKDLFESLFTENLTQLSPSLVQFKPKIGSKQCKMKPRLAASQKIIIVTEIITNWNDKIIFQRSISSLFQKCVGMQTQFNNREQIYSMGSFDVSMEVKERSKLKKVIRNYRLYPISRHILYLQRKQSIYMG